MSRPQTVAAMVPITIRTVDGVALRGVHVAGVPGGPAVVVAHGFTNATAKSSTTLVIRSFARFGAVVAVDFRGHGRSGGLASVGRDEVLDLDAAVGFARTAGYRPIYVAGFSMGGSIALRHAVLGQEKADAVASVSSPSRWYVRDTLQMRKVHWLLESPVGAVTGRFLGIRLAAPWTVIPETPLELIDRIAPTPLLLVHGTDDHYFSPAHALALRAASRDHAELWIEAGMGHAESGSSPDLIERIARWALIL